MRKNHQLKPQRQHAMETHDPTILRDEHSFHSSQISFLFRNPFACLIFIVACFRFVCFVHGWLWKGFWQNAADKEKRYMEIKLYEYEHCYWKNGESIEWRGADWASHLMMMRVSKFVYLFARFTQNVLHSKIWRRNVNIWNFMRTMNVRGREKRTNKQPRAHTSHRNKCLKLYSFKNKKPMISIRILYWMCCVSTSKQCVDGL